MRDHVGLQAADVFDGTALDGVPLMLAVEIQERVVAEKAHQRLRREVEDAGGGGGPDRAGKWGDIVIAEIGPGAKAGQKITDRHGGVVRHRLGVAVEVEDVGDHPQKARVQSIAALGKQRINRGEAIFQPPALDRGPKAHAAFHGGDGQLFEQLHQMRIIHLVVDDKAGVDRLILALACEHGASVAAKAGFGFIKHNGVGVGQKMRCCHAGNPPSDNGNAAAGGTHGLKRHSDSFLGWGVQVTRRTPDQITSAEGDRRCQTKLTRRP